MSFGNLSFTEISSMREWLQWMQRVQQYSHLAAPASLLITLALSLYFLTCVARRSRLHHTNFISLACLSIAQLLIAMAAIGLSLTAQMTGKRLQSRVLSLLST